MKITLPGGAKVGILEDSREKWKISISSRTENLLSYRSMHILIFIFFERPLIDEQTGKIL